ncbi:protein-tyrosine-phosphatase PTP1 isoform X2 [Physcomitrium patens]|uniref:protein-tyrosine-phosphatase n=1 Tax=Physcomitrium patens TaxID=3218 RepID=A0A7I4AJU8_PHYPA|nr:protein-tyrosine-phosphatase PTP1-like isoform X2 [Physcomitrium patens]|eukprot:XP_024391954.1 protein-tyrosine-phosphatase PTP1-like isoform X2 [Physcomitrella patens]
MVKRVKNTLLDPPTRFNGLPHRVFDPDPRLSSNGFNPQDTSLSRTEDALGFWRQRRGSRTTVQRRYSRQGEKMLNYKALSSTTVAVMSNNRAKNRYIDVLPYDITRVILDKRHYDPTCSDYINASFVQDNAHEDLPRYIATQGPLPSTVSDFWTMVLQQRCPVIIMLVGVVDGDQSKYAHYFPRSENQSETFGHIVVLNKKMSHSQHGITRRVFEVKDIKSPEPPMTLAHYEYLEWSDYGVPDSTRSVCELIRASFCIPPSAGPFVVHCSAGIGRTGTYCTIDHTLRRIMEGDLEAVDIGNTVRNFRSQRHGMVQTRDQYRFCYEVVIKELESYVSAGPQT